MTGRTRALVAAWWFALLCGLLVYSSPLREALWVLYLPVHWGCLMVGVVVLAAGIVASVRGRRVEWLPICIAAAGIALFLFGGFRLGRIALFELRRDRYEALLSEAMRAGEVPGEHGMIDEGPPVRYAFYWERGVIDNWVAVVHDPTGEVMRANEFQRDWSNWASPDLQGVKRLFGGDLRLCEHMGGSWYLCWFT